MQITTAQQIKDIIEPIPAEKFICSVYGDKEGNCCFLGHIHVALSPNKSYFGDDNGYGARQLTRKFLIEKHGINTDGSDVNNYETINGYTEPVIKDRIMHLIEDMITANF